MIADPEFIIISNLIFVVIVFFFAYRMIRAATIYNWNPGKSDLQYKQKIKILTSIVAIVCIGTIAAAVNIIFG